MAEGSLSDQYEFFEISRPFMCVCASLVSDFTLMVESLDFFVLFSSRFDFENVL